MGKVLITHSYKEEIVRIISMSGSNWKIEPYRSNHRIVPNMFVIECGSVAKIVNALARNNIKIESAEE